MRIGRTKQLLFDDFIVAELRNARRSTGTLAPQVVVEPDAPWEAGYALSAAGGVVKEDSGEVRLWYNLHNASGSGASAGITALAVSGTDGRSFTKPVLGLRGRTNFLLGNSMENGAQSVWLDQHASSPQEKYKGQHEDSSSGEIAMAASPDGLHWHEFARWNFQGNADSRTQVFWDERVGKYVMVR